MARVPFPRPLPDPRRSNTFVDTCAFDPKVEPEHSSAQRIRAIRHAGNISILLAHSNQKEVDHPNTPAEMKAEAGDMNFTGSVPLTPEENQRRERVRRVMIGDGNPERYQADADHVFEAGKYGAGYFVTTDHRILSRKAELDAASGAIIVKPSEWLAIYDERADA